MIIKLIMNVYIVNNIYCNIYIDGSQSKRRICHCNGFIIKKKTKNTLNEPTLVIVATTIAE